MSTPADPAHNKAAAAAGAHAYVNKPHAGHPAKTVKEHLN